MRNAYTAYILVVFTIGYHLKSVSSEDLSRYGAWPYTESSSSSSSSSSRSAFRPPHRPYHPQRYAPYSARTATGQQLQVPLPLLSQQPERQPVPEYQPSHYGRLSQIVEPSTVVHTTTTRTAPIEGLAYTQSHEISLVQPIRQEAAQEVSRIRVGPYQNVEDAWNALKRIIDSNKRITYLDLSSNPLGNQALAELANSWLTPYLTYLNIANTGINDQGMRLLRNFIFLTNLDISHNRLSDNALNILAAAVVNSAQITSLNLNYNFITGEGLQVLAEKFTNLRELLLAGTIITSVDLMLTLAQSPLATKLTLLDLRDTAVPKAKLGELKKLFPNAKIII